jgi:uncharacterized protein
MITKVNDIDLKVLTLFTKGYNKELYIREVGKLLKISSRTALLTLDKLEKIGILESKTRGKIKIYIIRRTGISKEYFLLAEQYKKIHFLEKNHLIKEILEKLDGVFDGIAVLFGSYAKGIQKEDSDLDLLIVGKYVEKEIKEVGHKYGIEINIKNYPMNIFKKDINEDLLLKEAAENHILINNSEEFLRCITRWIK